MVVTNERSIPYHVECESIIALNGVYITKVKVEKTQPLTDYLILRVIVSFISDFFFNKTCKVPVSEYFFVILQITSHKCEFRTFVTHVKLSTATIHDGLFLFENT